MSFYNKFLITEMVSRNFKRFVPNNFFPLYVLLYLFFSFKLDKFIQISIPTLFIFLVAPCIFFIFKARVIILRIRNFLFSKEGACFLIFLASLFSSIIFNTQDFSLLHFFNDISLSFFVSLVTYSFLRVFFTEQINYNLLHKIFSCFLILSGFLTTFQYFDPKISWNALFSLNIYDQKGAGFSDFPQDNSGLCFWTFVTISVEYFLSKKTSLLNLLKLVPIFFGFIAILNTHSRSSFLVFLFLFAFIFLFSIGSKKLIKTFFCYFLTIILSFSTLELIYSLNGVDNSRQYEALSYLPKVFQSFGTYNKQKEESEKVKSTEVTSVNDMDRSTNSRLNSDIFALKLIPNNLLMGVGPGNFTKFYAIYKKSINPSFLDPHETIHIHNHFLSVLVEFGLIGFLGFVCLQFYVVRDTIVRGNSKSMPFIVSFVCLSLWFLFTASISQRLFWVALLACSAPLSFSRNDV